MKTDSIQIPIKPSGKNKNICFYFFSENSDFITTYNHLGILPSQVKYVFVPYMSKPVITRLTPHMRQDIKSRKLIPVSGRIGEYDSILGKNFYLENSVFINKIINKYKIKQFNTSAAYKKIKPVVDIIGSIPEKMYERVLLYSVDLTTSISSDIKRRKSYIILMNLLEGKIGRDIIYFDKLILHYFDSYNKNFVLLWDKNKTNNLPKVKTFLRRLQYAGIADEDSLDDEIDVEKNVETSVDSTTSSEINNDVALVSKEKVDKTTKIKTIVKQFITNVGHSQINNTLVTTSDSDELVKDAIIYNMVGNEDKAKKISKKLDMKNPKVKDYVINTLSKNVLPRKPAVSSSRLISVNISDPVNMVDNINPAHILDGRKDDFNINLKSDIKNAFKVLETADIPLKVKSTKVEVIDSPASEVDKTIMDRHSYELIDEEGVTHSINIDLPHLTDNGSFLVNGRQRVLINQIVTYPIFFFKPFEGRYESIYSTCKVYSKRLSNEKNYLRIYIQGYDVPLVMVLGYKYGLKSVMKSYGVDYVLSDKKEDHDFIKLPNGKFIKFITYSELGKNMVESFVRSIPNFPPKMEDIESPEFWLECLVNETGTRNCIYPIDEFWKYGVTPVEQKILSSKGDPITVEGIIKYIASNCVMGRVDDRNDLNKLRVRSSEVFTHLIQKQIISAYNEYRSKKLSGDENATMQVNTRHAYSQVITSQNVQLMESINPIEELSMLTRITPVGIGGIPNPESFPESARNIHSSYYGNIDPLETPDSANIGIQQHLTLDSNITNVRGMFSERNKNRVKPSGILSVGPSLVPFVEANEGARVLMGTGQAKQAIPLENPDVPAVLSGYESILAPLLSDNFIKKTSDDGIIKEITDQYITINTTSGKTKVIDLSPRTLKSGQGKDGISKFSSTVRVGDKVRKGDIVATGSCIKDGFIANGKNILVAWMPWGGYNFEDATVFSKTASKKLTSIHIQKEYVTVLPDEEVTFIAKIGDVLEKGGILLSYSNVVYDIHSYKHLRTDGGKLINIEIYPNISSKEIPEVVKDPLEKFKKSYSLLYGKFPIGSFKEKGERIEGTLYRFVLEQTLPLEVGDKTTNRHGAKGCNSIILDDEDMPMTPWGDHVEAVLNPVGVINRMNSGQIYEIHCGLISKELANRTRKLSRKEFSSLLNTILSLLDGTPDKMYVKKTIKNITSMSDVQYNKMISQIQQSGFYPIIVPPFKSPSKNNILEALKVLGLKPRYKLRIKDKDGKYVWTDEEVAVGYITIYKLEHISEKKIHARAMGGYVGKTMTPTVGKRAGGGQSFSEYDMIGCLAYDANYVIEEFLGPLSSDHSKKSEMISDIIHTGKTTFKESVVNPARDYHEILMLALHLRTE